MKTSKKIGMFIGIGLLLLIAVTVSLSLHKKSQAKDTVAEKSNAQSNSGQTGSAPKAMTFTIGEVTPYPLKQGGWSEYLNVPYDERISFNWEENGTLLVEIDGKVFEVFNPPVGIGQVTVNSVTDAGNIPVSKLPLGSRFRFMMSPSSKVAFTTVDITPLGK